MPVTVHRRHPRTRRRPPFYDDTYVQFTATAHYDDGSSSAAHMVRDRPSALERHRASRRSPTTRRIWGRVYGIAPGTATLTVSARSTTRTTALYGATAALTVTAPPPPPPPPSARFSLAFGATTTEAYPDVDGDRRAPQPRHLVFDRPGPLLRARPDRRRPRHRHHHRPRRHPRPHQPHRPLLRPTPPPAARRPLPPQPRHRHLGGTLPRVRRGLHLRGRPVASDSTG